METLIEQDWDVLRAFVLSVCAFLAIVPFNLVGLHWSARLYHRLSAGDLRSLKFQYAVLYILMVMLVLFILHLLTNFAWGLFGYLAGALPTYREGVFYSLENYTGLGLTRVQVPEKWRMLAPMISLSGVFCLGWSTAVLVGVFGPLYRQPPNT